MSRFKPPTEWMPGFAADAPWARPLARAAQAFVPFADWPEVSDYNLAVARSDLRTGSGAPLRFVLQPPARRRGRVRVQELTALYDGRIYTTGEVPTRERNWHDWLNALVWASFPRAKAALNARQYAAHRARLGDCFEALPSTRTREQDALAMVDEGSLLLLHAREHGASARSAVAAGDVRAVAELCVNERVVPLIFGHALYEHLVAGDGSPRGMVVLLEAPDGIPLAAQDRTTVADGALAAALADPDRFTSVPLAPGLPLSAVPWGR